MDKIINKIENFEMHVNEVFLKKAQNLEPTLHHREIRPRETVCIEKQGDIWNACKRKQWNRLSESTLGKKDSICFDFGSHYVGYLTIKLETKGSPPDAPAHIRLKMGETVLEIGEDSSCYEGSISSSWIQEEYLHIDVLPATIRIPRRYALRYLELKVLDTSPKYRIVVQDVFCDAVTAAERLKVQKLPRIVPDSLRRIDEIAIKTLEECMQSVFEDGPKRDRRLWIGDLRLQALTDYETFRDYSLVKRCLYLFAGLTQNKGSVGACIFLEPSPQVDDTLLFDYSLLFISCLYDYFTASGDVETVEELWNTAYLQAELAMERVGRDGVVRDSDDWWCFLDWEDGLNKQAGAQGVLLYTLRHAYALAEHFHKTEKKRLAEMIETVEAGAKNILWDEKKGFFVSGRDKQLSWASQIWMVLARVFPKETNRDILGRLLESDSMTGIATPYMYHYLIDALLQNDMREEAYKYLEWYWGQMAEEGADCFYELYNPNNKMASPYGSRMIHSYCHAWSCTPAYFIRKYFCEHTDEGSDAETGRIR